MFSPCFTRSLQLGIATCMQKIHSTKQRMWCQFANIFMVICYIYFILVQDVVKVDLIMVDVYSRFQKSLPQPLFPKKGVIGPPDTFVSYLAHSLTDLPDSWCIHVITSALRCRPPQRHQRTAFFCCCKSHCSLTCCHLLRKTCMLYGLDMGWDGVHSVSEGAGMVWGEVLHVQDEHYAQFRSVCYIFQISISLHAGITLGAVCVCWKLIIMYF
jgi:hypothetical protein